MNTTLRHIYIVPTLAQLHVPLAAAHPPIVQPASPFGARVLRRLFQWISGHLHQSFADKMNYPMEPAASTMTLDRYHLLLLHDTKTYISPDLVHVYAIALRATIILMYVACSQSS